MFDINDRVFHIYYGWGKVTKSTAYIVKVVFDGETEERYFHSDESLISLLSYTEYTLEGFSSERPEPSWIDIYQEWYDSNGDILLNSFLEYLEKNFEIPIRKCK